MLYEWPHTEGDFFFKFHLAYLFTLGVGWGGRGRGGVEFRQIYANRLSSSKCKTSSFKNDILYQHQYYAKQVNNCWPK